MSVKSESMNEAKLDKPKSYTKKDFTSDQNIRWCPGCGDYSILAQMQRVMPEICEELNIAKENIVFITFLSPQKAFSGTKKAKALRTRGTTLCSVHELINVALEDLSFKVKIRKIKKRSPAL